MLRLMLDEIRDGASSLELECNPEEINLEFEGADFIGNVSIKLDLFRQSSNIFVKAITSVNVELECSRCIERVSIKLEAVVQVQYSPLPKVAYNRIDDIGIGYYDNEYIDLSDEIRESLLLELPMTVLCSEECKGLCPSCGQNLNRGECDCSEPESLSESGFTAFNKLLEVKGKLEV